MICISLIARDDEHFFICLSIDCISSPLKCLFNSLAHIFVFCSRAKRHSVLAPVKMAVIKNISNDKCWRVCGEKALIHCWWGCKLVHPLWKAVWRFLRKLGMEPPLDPAIPLHGLYPKDLKSAHYRDTATFIAAQFTIARLWNQPRCPSDGEWLKKLWHRGLWCLPRGVVARRTVWSQNTGACPEEEEECGRLDSE